MRRDFPILAQRRNGKPLIYLDSAASAQKPRAVLDAIDDCYQRYYANVHRGVHWLAARASGALRTDAAYPPPHTAWRTTSPFGSRSNRNSVSSCRTTGTLIRSTMSLAKA